MEKMIAVIRNVPIFSGLEGDEIDAVLRIAVERRFSRGELIFSDGDLADGFYVVAEGKVKVFKMSFDGKEQILHIFGPGEPFGEVPVFSGKSFPASAQAIAASRLVFFPRKAMIDLLAEKPALALNMLAVMSMRLRQFTVQIENLSLKEVPERLASYLMYLAREKDAEDTVRLDISKGHLASLLGTIPETLSRIFAKMSGDELIEVNGREIRLIDREGLAELAGLDVEEK